MKIELLSQVPTGFTVAYDGQRYVCTGRRMHVRQDGEPVWLTTWRSHCADCGEPFECGTVAKLELVRRCPEHRKAGVRVNPKRRASANRSKA